MCGFNDWVEQIADSSDAVDYRKRVSEPETALMWQSLTYGANYKSAYCMAVCPAGEDVIGPYLKDKAAHRREILRPLQERPETIYVVAGTDAEDVVSPSGKGWGPSTIHGNRQRGTGILNNELYIGRMVWNRLRYIKDPATGKRVSRLNPQDKWIVKDVPELRIIDQELWDRVKARQEAVEGRKFGQANKGHIDRRIPRYMFSGLMVCGVCGVPGSQVKDKMAQLEARKTELQRKLERAEQDAPVLLHPNMADYYRSQIEDLRAALADTQNRRRSIEALRAMIETIELMPLEQDGKKTLAINLRGPLAAILSLAANGAGAQTKKPPQRDGVFESVAMIVVCRIYRRRYACSVTSKTLIYNVFPVEPAGFSHLPHLPDKTKGPRFGTLCFIGCGGRI